MLKESFGVTADLCYNVRVLGCVVVRVKVLTGCKGVNSAGIGADDVLGDIGFPGLLGR